jgi:pilus assembly protein CpaB
MGRRARAFALLGAATVCAGVAMIAVRNETERVRSQVGGLVPAVVVTQPIPSGMRFTATTAASHLTVRRVPARFVPPAALVALGDAAGERAAVSLRAGDYLTSGLLRRSAAATAGAAHDAGARLIEVAVAGASTIGQLLQPGTAVDVLITTQGSGSPRTYLALQNVTLAGFAVQDGGGGGDAANVSGVASLRVSLREAVLLTAAQSFARELRLVPRPQGAGSAPPLQVRARDL